MTKIAKLLCIILSTTLLPYAVASADQSASEKSNKLTFPMNASQTKQDESKIKTLKLPASSSQPIKNPASNTDNKPSPGRSSYSSSKTGSSMRTAPRSPIKKAITIYVDAKWGSRTEKAAATLTEHHNDYAKKGYQLQDVDLYTEDGDLKGFFVSYIQQ